MATHYSHVEPELQKRLRVRAALRRSRSMEAELRHILKHVCAPVWKKRNRLAEAIRRLLHRLGVELELPRSELVGPPIEFDK